MTQNIGVDLMGSDRSPETIWRAALEVAEELGPEQKLVLIGTKETLDQVPGDFETILANQEISMDDPPLLAVRRKRDSSLLLGVQAVADGKLDAFVSAGNTGALIAGSAFLLPLLPGIERPALLATLPTVSHPVACIDIGGNVDARPEYLLQFARMGAAYQRCRFGIERPKVGLLNIGSEALKGNRETREVFNLLQSQHNSDLDFVGNIEGRDVFMGVVDVMVSDGFTGNVFLKTAEGISSFILEYLHEAFGDSADPAVREALVGLNAQVNYAEHPGAIVCGVEGVVIKCHGFSSQLAIANGIRGASSLVENQLIPRLRDALHTDQ